MTVANASAVADTTLRCLRREEFEAFLFEHPQAAEVIRGIGERRRHSLDHILVKDL